MELHDKMTDIAVGEMVDLLKISSWPSSGGGAAAGRGRGAILIAPAIVLACIVVSFEASKLQFTSPTYWWLV